MKVLHLMGTLRPSGMERMFLSASSHFLDARVESVIVGQGSNHTFEDDLIRAGYRVETISPLRSSQGVLSWVKLLRAEMPDIVHIHTESAFAFSVLATRIAMFNVPILRTVHNVFVPKGRARLSRRAQSILADPMVTRFIAVSPDVMTNELNYGRRSSLIFNWVDDRFYSLTPVPKGAAEPSAIIVGNSSSIKNHVLALRAIEASSHVLYFHGDEKNASEEELQILDRLEAAGRIRYRGTADPSASLAAGPIFLLPSLHEGMCIALAEALVAGVPAVVNDAPGVQWSKSFPNVLMIGSKHRDWVKALESHVAGAVPIEAGVKNLPVDLSARRGSRELLDLYHALTAHPEKPGVL